MNNSKFRIASLHEASLVLQISSSAYIPAYLNVVDTIPAPASEDYSERIAAGNVWLCERGGVAIGVLVVEMKTSFLEVYSIAVSPAYQGLGIGLSLLAFAETLAKTNDLSELHLYTNIRMTNNIRLYEKAGFKKIRSYAHPNRQGQFLVEMAKILS